MNPRATPTAGSVQSNERGRSSPSAIPPSPDSPPGEGRHSQLLGRDHCTLVAGPCAVESFEQLDRTAAFLARIGVRWLRGGVFKSRTSPHSFQGLGAEGLEILAEVARRHGLGIVTEVTAVAHVKAVAEVAAGIQIGARHMQNVPLLEEAGGTGRTVLLKRSFGATLDELLAAAEYVQRAGGDVILCERGIRSFGTDTRFTFDVSAIPLLQARSGLPVVADPSHAAGRADLVPALALAAVAAGADGLLVEVHPDPARALCDGEQALDFAAFESLQSRAARVARALDRTIDGRR